jgi:CheY-like chemotaxis protein
MSDDNPDRETGDPAGDSAPAILIVDDDELIRMVVSDHLQECGYVVRTASSGDEGLSILEAEKVPIALILTDVVMPGSIDGFQLTQWVRRNRPDLPIILTSGYSKKASIAQDLCPGVPFIPKPFRLADMAHSIRGLLDAKGASAGRR